jgi:hypothetical protein
VSAVVTSAGGCGVVLNTGSSGGGFLVSPCHIARYLGPVVCLRIFDENFVVRTEHRGRVVFRRTAILDESFVLFLSLSRRLPVP